MKFSTIEHIIWTLYRDNKEHDLEEIIDIFHYAMKMIDKQQINWIEWSNTDKDILKEKIKNAK